MAQTDVHVLEDTEHERIQAWRAEELERAGYGTRAAGRLAARQDIDLHHAVGLLEQGCPPELAVKILL
ncbi:MAG TPA: hypothetical protein VFO03_09755 [Gaiellaceae bacterium]|nr:hypothetical protein [Gaiellaceae bacterium]